MVSVLRTVQKSKRVIGLVAALLLCALMGVSFPNTVSAQATISDRSLRLSNSLPGGSSRYDIGLTAPAVPLLGSVMVEFCVNSPLPTEPCDAPVGFDVTTATLATQTGDGGFVIDPSTTANVLVLSRVPAPSTGVPSTYVLDGVTNASDAGTQYARYNTYATDDASGTLLDRGSIAYVLNYGFGLATEVPPYLDFCLGTSITSTDCSAVTGNYVSLGDFDADEARTGQVQMAIATNAGNGYTIRINGNTLASGNNALPPLQTPTLSAPGVSQFGINLRANTRPASGLEPSGLGTGSPSADYNIPNRFTFRSGDVLASRNGVEDYRKYTVTYLVNISRNQPPGIYAGTYTYLALGNF